MKVSVSQHAIDRAVEHFRVPRLTADEWLRSQFRRATFVANIIGDDGKPVRLFAVDRVAFIVADTQDFVLTVYPRHASENEIARKVRSVVKRELAAAERKERATERRVAVAKAKLAVEIAQCN